MYEFIGPNSHATISKSWFTVLAILFVWEAVWKLIALWKAGKNRQLAWFIAMAVLNTVGILEIVYILFFQKKQPTRHQQD